MALEQMKNNAACGRRWVLQGVKGLKLIMRQPMDKSVLLSG